jgi:hypothetical protein
MVFHTIAIHRNVAKVQSTMRGRPLQSAQWWTVMGHQFNHAYGGFRCLLRRIPFSSLF